jgi:hypothetical protein
MYDCDAYALKKLIPMPVPKSALGAERPSLSRETPQMASRPLQRNRIKDRHFDKAGAMSALVLMTVKQMG